MNNLDKLQKRLEKLLAWTDPQTLQDDEQTSKLLEKINGNSVGLKNFETFTKNNPHYVEETTKQARKIKFK